VETLGFFESRKQPLGQSRILAVIGSIGDKRLLARDMLNTFVNMNSCAIELSS
jgi:hypothetical protein